MNSDSPRIIRVAPATVIIFSVLLSPALLSGSLLIWRGQQIPEALGLCAAYIALIYWICSPSVEFTQNELIYRAFLKRGAITLSDITGVSMSAHPAPTIELVKKKGKGEPFSFIVKPFSKEGVIALLHHIRTCCPEARFDGIATDMSKGDFESITREAISSQNLIRIALVAGSATFAAAIARALFHK